MKKRIEQIDAAKGIAIILVVIGHIVGRTPPLNNEWYFILKSIIFKFHVPVFFFLSGITYAMSNQCSKGNLNLITRKKLVRFVAPFMFFSTVIFLGKLFCSTFLYVENIPQNISDFLYILISPRDSFSPFLWFIYTLFLYYLTIPYLLFLFNSLTLLTLVSLFFLLWQPQINFFCINDYFFFLPFFCLGMLYVKNGNTIKIFIIRNKHYLATIFIIATPFFFFMNETIVSLLALLPFLALSHLEIVQNKILCSIGKNSYSIYLMNSIYIGTVKALLMFFIPFNDGFFLIFFFILGIVGVALPILTKNLLANKHPQVATVLG